MNKLKQSLQTILKAFVFFGRAFKNAKKDFWISIQVLFWVSLALSILFYFVEHAAQPDEYRNWWQAFVWTLTRYIGDPGHFSMNDPITIAGRFIATLLGIMKILIYSVPAGLFAKAYVKIMKEDRKHYRLEECRGKIRESFRRRLNKTPAYRAVPRRISPVTLQTKKGMTENDIIETASKFDEFSLRNLAASQTASEHPQDRLVIELLPLNEKTVDWYDIEKKSYGVKINRQSNVTIVAPTAATENSIGHFAYYLAQFGGFNFISREFVVDVDEPVSYYKIEGNQEDWEEPLKNFVSDIKEISYSKEKWNIVMVAADNVQDTQVHFVHKTIAKCHVRKTTLDEDKLQKLFEELANTLKANHNILSDLDEKYKPVGDKNIGVASGGGSENNAFILRISYSIITWSDYWMPIVVDMAEVIRDLLETPERKQMFEKESEMRKRLESSWKKKGVGFGEGTIQGGEKTQSIRYNQQINNSKIFCHEN